jgi:hypothetical protein
LPQGGQQKKQNQNTPDTQSQNLIEFFPQGGM